MQISLPFSGPYNWDAMLSFLHARAVPGIEAVDRRTYRRTVQFGAVFGALEVSMSDSDDRKHLTLSVDRSLEVQIDAIAHRTRGLFGLDVDASEVESVFAADPLLGPLVRTHSGLRIPGTWDPFELAIRAVLGQQVTVKGATTLAGRLVARAGVPLAGHVKDKLTHLFPSPEQLQQADLNAIGMPRKRIKALQLLAAAVEARRVTFERHNTTQSRAQLMAIPGIGEWTAGYIALCTLGDHDIFLEGDIALRRAVSHGSALIAPSALRALATRWAPWRGYAVMYLWRSLGKQLKKELKGKGPDANAAAANG